MRSTILIGLLLLAGKIFAQSGYGGYIHERDSERYSETMIGGWKVKVNVRLLEDHQLITTKAEAILATELQQIEKLLPKESIPYLKEMPIWLEFTTPNNKSVQYHLSAKWLSQHGYNPKKESSLEIVVTEYVNMSHDSLPLLSMMGYVYQDRVLGLKNEEIEGAFKHAKATDIYIVTVGRRKIFLFATISDYFAAITAAYFGDLSYEPYNRKKLKEIDPRGYELVEKLWKVRG